MTRRRPGPSAVIWTSVVLFAVLFALLTYQLGTSLQTTAAAPRPTLVRQVLKRKVVTTVVPTPGRSTVTAAPVTTSSEPVAEAAPVTTAAS